ncbi:hypothetical protein TRIUR3_31601 [Triticum urartu]|uniref:Uncharacterized protein n=1 Tax=Triticum urartu TaxID=4572 RepID=M7YZ95_TRIUA|nr:hypothetical protein TRIUR3_31601 [Triticum urartu]
MADALPEFGSTLDEEGKGAAAVAAGVRDANKRTALHFAAREGQTEVCRFLIDVHDLKKMFVNDKF